MRGKYTAATNYIANAVFDETTNQNLEYQDLIKNPKYAAAWKQSAANEFGCLDQGVGQHIPSGTDIIHFIPKHKVPANKVPTYACFVTNICLQKKDVHCTMITVGETS
eukprot:11467307-Ditylum_brightwellii.AAC.1